MAGGGVVSGAVGGACTAIVPSVGAAIALPAASATTPPWSSNE